MNFGPRNPGMMPFMGNFNFGSSPMRPSFRPFMGAPQQMMQRGGGGGLLSRLFGGRQGMGMGLNQMRAAGSTAAQGGGLLRTLNPTSIGSFLTNTQKVLNTAQQVGPLVQQYGPMVKNIPSIWRLYRGLKNATNNSNTDDDKKEEKNKKENDMEVKNKETENSESNDTQTKKNTPLPSKPKLYI